VKLIVQSVMEDQKYVVLLVMVLVEMLIVNLVQYVMEVVWFVVIYVMVMVKLDVQNVVKNKNHSMSGFYF
jgi:hypothetical protein